MNALPLVNHSYASGTQSAAWHDQRPISRSFDRTSNETEDRSSVPEHEQFLHTLRSHFEQSRDPGPADKPAQMKNANSGASSEAKQDAKSSANQPQPDRVEDRNAVEDQSSAQEHKQFPHTSGSDFDQNKDALPTHKPAQAQGKNPIASSALTPVMGTSADQVQPDAKNAPKTAQVSERTVNSKPAEDSVRTPASKAHEPKEPEDSEQAVNSSKAVAQLLDNTAALICDIAPNAAAAPAPFKPNDNTPSRGATIDAASVVEAPDASLPAAGPILGDLAFALRIKASSNNTSEQPAHNGALLPRNSDSVLSNSTSPASSPILQEKRTASPIGGVVAPVATNDDGSPAPHNAAPAEVPTPTHASDFEAELSKFRAAEPVRGAHVQISGADAPRIDIRLVERAGALSVTVRSADNTLAKNLQEHVSELNTRLNLEHYRTELWTPSANSTSNTRDFGAGDQQNGSGSYSGNSNQDQQQSNKQKQSQPDWIDALEQNSKAFQKRIEYTWQQ